MPFYQTNLFNSTVPDVGGGAADRRRRSRRDDGQVGLGEDAATHEPDDQDVEDERHDRRHQRHRHEDVEACGGEQ